MNNCKQIVDAAYKPTKIRRCLETQQMEIYFILEWFVNNP